MKTILWDFDGVILESMKIRDEGFYKIFETYPIEQVEKLIAFNNENGGLSRYVKIRYFYNEVLGEPVSDEKVNELAAKFSEVMLQKLINPELIIYDSVDFIKQNHTRYNFHIVSGSDGKELNSLCQKLELAQYFITINGSPTPKITLVENILKKYDYPLNETILIGDSKNDHEAAIENNITFYGYNNRKLTSLGNYIDTFKLFDY